MKSTILVIAGLVTGIGATAYTLSTQKLQPADVTTRVAAPIAEPAIKSPFAPVATPTLKIVNDAGSNAATIEPPNTQALPETSIAEAYHYRDVIAYLQYIDNAGA